MTSPSDLEELGTVRAEYVLPKPPSVNELNGWGKGRVFLSVKYRTWKEEAGWALKQQKLRAGKITGRYTLRLILSSVKRRGDCDNRLKATLDLFKEHGITPDDRYCEKATAEWGDAQEGTCRVVIERAA